MGCFLRPNEDHYLFIYTMLQEKERKLPIKSMSTGKLTVDNLITAKKNTSIGNNVDI